MDYEKLDARWSYRYGGSSNDIAQKRYPTSLLRNEEFVLTSDCDESGHWLRGINGASDLQAVLDTLNAAEILRPDGWERQDMEAAFRSLKKVAWHLGVIGNHETEVREALLSVPGLHLEDHEGGVAEIARRDIQEDCLRAIDELKTLVVYLHRRTVEAVEEIASMVDVSTISTNPHDWAVTLTQIREIVSGSLGGKPDAVAMAADYIQRMRNFPIRSQYERSVGDS